MQKPLFSAIAEQSTQCEHISENQEGLFEQASYTWGQPISSLNSVQVAVTLHVHATFSNSKDKIHQDVDASTISTSAKDTNDKDEQIWQLEEEKHQKDDKIWQKDEKIWQLEEKMQLKHQDQLVVDQWLNLRNVFE